MSRKRQAAARTEPEIERPENGKLAPIFTGNAPNSPRELLDECNEAQARINRAFERTDDNDGALFDLDAVREMHRRWFHAMQRICDRRGDGLEPESFPKHLMESSRQSGMYGTFVFTAEGMREPREVMPGELRQGIEDVRTWALARLAEDMAAANTSIWNGKAPTAPAPAANEAKPDDSADWNFDNPGTATFRGVEFSVNRQLRKLLVKLASRNRAFTAVQLWEAMANDDPANSVRFEKSNVKQHIGRLRKLLKSVFDVSDERDPLPCVDKDGDRTAWKLDASTLSPKSPRQKL